MKVTVEFFGPLRPLAGNRNLALELSDGCTARDALAAAAEAEPALASHLFREGALDKSLLVSVGDRQVLAPAERALSPGETVTVMAPISGG